MFPLNSSQRAAINGLRREFEQSIGLRPELPPGVAVFDTPTALIVELDLPGVDKSGINLSLEKDVLRIVATRPSRVAEGAEGQSDHRANEGVEHVFRLGFAVDTSGVDATSRNGVLQITLPKAAEEQPHRISVRDADV